MAMIWTTRLVAGLAVAFGFFTPVAADEVADFYKGKTVSVVVGHETGTGFDIYSRALARGSCSGSSIPRRLRRSPRSR